MFQVFTLVVFTVLVIVGFLTGTVGSYGSNLRPVIRKTNLATLVVWGIWWPGLILITILLGRAWCTVCPMEFVSNIANRTAKWLGIKGMVLPDWLRKGFIVLVSYIILQLLVAGFQIHRTPIYTAYMLITLLLVALLVGFLFREPRAFCKSFCPASILLDIYGRLSPVALNNNKDDVCAQCMTKDCVKSENRYRIDGRSCPSFLLPFKLKKSDPCVLCFQCTKICPHDNIGFGIVKSSTHYESHINIPAVLFIFIASGFVSHELFSEIPALDNIFHTVPKWLAAWSGFLGLKLSGSC